MFFLYTLYLFHSLRSSNIFIIKYNIRTIVWYQNTVNCVTRNMAVILIYNVMKEMHLSWSTFKCKWENLYHLHLKNGNIRAKINIQVVNVLLEIFYLHFLLAKSLEKSKWKTSNTLKKNVFIAKHFWMEQYEKEVIEHIRSVANCS